MTTPRANVRKAWRTCPNCLIGYMGTEEGLCATCLTLTREAPTDWRELSWNVRVLLWLLVLIAGVFVFRVASDLWEMLHGWWR
jgi:hypothetical protein